MIIKKFLGKTEEEAVEAAKKELGNGIVIMNVKTVKQKGLMALFRPKMTEVTVALEEEKDSQRFQRKEKNAGTAGGSVLQGEQPISGAGNTLQAGESSLEDRVSIEKKLDNLQNLLVSRFQQSEEERKDLLAEEEALDSGESEEEGETEEKEAVTEQQRFMKLLYNTMLESEVDEKYANQIVDEVDVSGQSNLPFDYILGNVYQKMILKFGRAEGIAETEGHPRIVVFMGPTGVGKTTTIAKIASDYVVEEKKKVALLTSDTYRIAAVDQLRTYANILEVPFCVIYSEDDVKEAIQEFAEYDYVFVDTAGHSHQNEEQLNHMKRLVEVVQEAGDSQFFLVLSATTKYRDLQKIVSCYNQVADYQLIFTKLDETDVLGNLLNLKLYTDKSIAYVTHGQNVPNDIELFNPQKTVKQILSKKQERNET
ncbi:flagellar biosynthesis protein FlhF [Acetatifactor aquisgranensis]|uniref:flagellar biosynthesis protein FlhF n=1 Tax=Acetatifactor aquisgranensis TaxID=2941233 RepID=UPI00203F835B|nr:flagellar biosynthesis protein FlhF [Acetatifactor aquisgranensis]MCI8543651.1 flagellar biosynthesis protein FlhF [Lachnospiraceae bacterium]